MEQQVATAGGLRRTYSDLAGEAAAEVSAAQRQRVDVSNDTGNPVRERFRDALKVTETAAMDMARIISIHFAGGVPAMPAQIDKKIFGEMRGMLHNSTVAIQEQTAVLENRLLNAGIRVPVIYSWEVATTATAVLCHDCFAVIDPGHIRVERSTVSPTGVRSFFHLACKAPECGRADVRSLTRLSIGNQARVLQRMAEDAKEAAIAAQEAAEAQDLVAQAPVAVVLPVGLPAPLEDAVAAVGVEDVVAPVGLPAPLEDAVAAVGVEDVVAPEGLPPLEASEPQV